VGRVNVAHLEAGTLAGQTARPKGRQAALVRHFRQRVGLVHELRQLRGAEEFAHRSRSRLGVDQVLRHHRVDLDRGHAFLDRPLHAQQADAVLVLHQLADRPDAAVAEVVDVVDLALAVAQFDQRLDTGDDVVLAQRTLRVGGIEVEAHVHLHAAHGRQVIALAVEEQALEQVRGRFDGRRLARAHHAVDVHQRAIAADVLVGSHGVADVGTDVDVVDVQHRDIGHAIVQQHLQRAAVNLAIAVIGQGDLVPGLDIDRAGFLVDDILGDIAANDMIERHQQFGNLRLVDQLLGQTRGDLVTGLADHFAGSGIHDVIGRAGATHTLGEEARDPAAVLHVLVGDGLVIGIHDAFLVEPQGIEQRRHRQLAATVDAREHDVLGVELEVQPRAAIGNDPAGEQQLARGVGLALVMVEEHARRAVHLGHDHPFGAVHDERPVRRHQGHVAHVDVLFLDVLDRLRAGILVDIEYDQPQRDLQRRSIGHVARLAFLDIVFRLLKLVFHELQNGVLVEVLDREHRLEHALNPVPVLRLRSVAGLQEQVVGGFLNLDEVRHFEDFTDLAEVLADALLANVALSHARRHLSSLRASSVGATEHAAE